MEGNPVKLTKQEEELAINFDKAMNAKDYEQALSHVSELIKLRENNPVYHLWLGDCYRVSAQVDNALDSYRKALDLDGKYYIVGGDFRKDVTRYINGLKLIQKATQAFSAKKYEEAIHWIDDFIKIDPNWGDISALRGQCNELLGNRVLAIKDYSLALKGKLSEKARPRVEDLIKPTGFRNLNLIIDEVEADSGAGDAIFVQEYVKLLQKIEELIPIYPEIAELPNFDRFSKDIDTLNKAMLQVGGDTSLIGIDEDGLFVATREELMRKKQKHPDRPYLFSLRVEDRKGLETDIIKVNLGKRLAGKQKTSTESRQKKLDWGKKNYDSNKQKLKAYQRGYYKKNKAQIRLKMKAYYIMSKQGKTRSYNVLEIGDKTVKVSPQE